MCRSIVRRMLLAMPVLVLAVMPQVGYPAHARTAEGGAATPVRAVRTLLRPYYISGYNFATCTKLSPRLHPNLTCPETPRLRHWLQVRRLPRAYSGPPFCRCQNPPRSIRLRQTGNNGRIAHVNAVWNYGPNSFTDTFVVLHRAGGWLVDDEYCAGRPGTSVYKGIAGQTPCRP